MTREEKAAQRAEARALRRRPRDEEPEPEAREEPAREEPAREEPERKEPEREEPRREAPRRRPGHEPHRGPRHGAPADRLPELAGRAREHLRALRGVDPESVSGFARTPDGWRVTLEVVELRRVPETTDVLASYEVELDGDGGLLRLERGRRYLRSQAEGALR